MERDVVNTKQDFFISFSRADREVATWVAWVLEEHGYSVLFQDWDFHGNFVVHVVHMDQAHREAERTLAVLSDNYFSSDFTLFEWFARFAEDLAGCEARLVPVKVGPLSDTGILKTLVYADIEGCKEDEAEKRLLERVARAVDPRFGSKPMDRPPLPFSERVFPQKPVFPEKITAPRYLLMLGIAALLISVIADLYFAGNRIDVNTGFVSTDSMKDVDIGIKSNGSNDAE